MTCIPKYQTYPEYKEHFDGFKNVCFGYNRAYCKKRERVIVQYPFVTMIMNGRLSSLPGFEMLTERSMAVYCSFETRTLQKPYVSLDILVFSKHADIFLFECKARTSEENDSDALAKLRKGSKRLVEYAERLNDFGAKLSENPPHLLSKRHNQRHTENHDFPHFNEFISESLRIDDISEQEEWCEKIADRMANGEVEYGLVFNGPGDEYKGVRGYDHIPKSSITESVLRGWDESIGDLNIFMVDYLNDTFSLLS